MSLRDIIKQKAHILVDGRDPPLVFADLILDSPPSPMLRVDVEQPGWLEPIQPLLNTAERAGLTMRDESRVRVWLRANGSPLRYLSRVVGQIGPEGHRRWRVAGLQCGDVSVWLHRDGLVEVGPEPQREN